MALKRIPAKKAAPKKAAAVAKAPPTKKVDGRSREARLAKAAAKVQAGLESKKTAQSAPATNGAPAGSHTDTEGAPITINIPDHPGRVDSKIFTNARATGHKILGTLMTPLYGPEPVQMHHGGSLWVMTDTGWRLVLNTLGIEWSAQFCADPAKVELLRQNAEAIVAGFPKTEDALTEVGCNHVKLLHKVIKTAADVGNWVDSIFNSCVPLPAQWHTGAQPNGAGEHHYPRPITNIEFVKLDSFDLFHPVEGGHVAVVPTGPPGSGAKTVEMLYATPGTQEHEDLAKAHAKGKQIILGARHTITKAAYARQGGPEKGSQPKKKKRSV